MRDVARAHNGVTGLERDPLIAALNKNLTFEDVEPFLLLDVEVEWRTPTGDEFGVLDGEEGGSFGG